MIHIRDDRSEWRCEQFVIPSDAMHRLQHVAGGICQRDDSYNNAETCTTVANNSLMFVKNRGFLSVSQVCKFTYVTTLIM